jgi:hypothetical protein
MLWSGVTEFVIRFMVLPLYFCLAEEPRCSAAIFGTPDLGDCEMAASKLPYATDSRGSRKAFLRTLFAEPQYLRPPFKSIDNRYRPLPINQLPKIWRSSNRDSPLHRASADDNASTRHM